MPTPKELGFRQPAEWEPHAACWLAWPSHRELWQEYLEAVQAEFTELCRAIAQSENLEILVPDEANAQLASDLLGNLSVNLHRIPFGDIWMRDIAPIFTVTQDRTQIAALNFEWNGWGQKYLLEHDEQVADRVTATSNLKAFNFPWILEGGAVEVDGQGTCLTTRQCLLNPNRNSHMNQTEIEAGVCDALGVDKILWLDRGLLNDHTDGHIDTIARFVAPGVVMCMRSLDSQDPNTEVLSEIASQLKTFTDVCGQRLEVIEILSPGLVLDPEQNIMPASYLNFYIANGSVIVPTYGTIYDEKAVTAIAACFPNRRTIGLSAKHILLGGGAFHCITQQQPQI
ncbi:agmatine deiminase family protein [Pseudanabaena sp. PCC 6802]|uniref:agmatine deiminase family protein n=1 Tax=Pseudanabaena sp. PCC 6802 TaxID=118173 RepID=UPI00034D5F6C|nr:agmatine deiminase family protein [Pseudanabaena sp. PCC 6802]